MYMRWYEKNEQFTFVLYTSVGKDEGNKENENRLDNLIASSKRDIGI